MTSTMTPAPAPLAPPAPAASATTDAGALIPIRIPTIAWVVLAVALLWIAYAFLGQNIAPNVWNHMHEFFHDGRHFLGIACH